LRIIFANIFISYIYSKSFSNISLIFLFITYNVILSLNKYRTNVIISRLLGKIIIIYYNTYLNDFYYISYKKNEFLTRIIISLPLRKKINNNKSLPSLNKNVSGDYINLRNRANYAIYLNRERRFYS